VLFGERTALPGKWKVGNFFPKSKTLAKGDSVILDAAPLFSRFLVGTSYSFCFAENADHQQMMQHLAQYRDSLPSAGYEPVHIKHPGEVLGHRAIKSPNIPFNLRLQGFDAVSLTWFKFKDSLAQRGLGRSSPLWNNMQTSDHPAHDGLWLVKPHADQGEVGAKWEEILVIENSQARWLDDTAPHIRQWSQIARGTDYRPSL